MKTGNYLISERVVAAAIVIALLLLINPFHMFMPSALVLLLVMLLAAMVIAFALFVWREQPRDERDEVHALRASRVSYVLGAGVLLTAIVAESLMHHLDPWLPAALGAMVLGKLGLRWWLRDR
jgi:uncharacterized membrane protein